MRPILYATDQLTSELYLLSMRGLKTCKDFKHSQTPSFCILNSVRAGLVSLLVWNQIHLSETNKKTPINQNPSRPYTSMLLSKTTVLSPFNLKSTFCWWEDHSPSESWINIRQKPNIFDVSRYIWNVSLSKTIA